ncbi:hypothetical protein PS664_02223 [Pseudomonas fluorescens]|nr:hypothetical protein PS664_02223 [Pseudomonas fluorescens]
MGQDRQNSASKRIGEWLGRVFRGYLTLERRILVRSQALGVPQWLVKTLAWMTKLCLLGAFFYLAFWVALITSLAMLGAWRLLCSDIELSGSRYEWRDGSLGYGLYDETGVRVDPYDPDDQA